MAALWLAGMAVPSTALGATPVAAAAPAPAPKAKCLECHDDLKLKTADGKSVAVHADEFNRSAHRKLDCVDCHALAAGAKHPGDPLGAVSPQVCQECLISEMTLWDVEGEKAIKDCMGCHDSLHKVRKEGDPASSLSPVNQIKTCGACHEEMMANYERSEHARALLKSGASISEINCVRRHLSAIKGGRLAALAHPARVVTLLISDVPGARVLLDGRGAKVAGCAFVVELEALEGRKILDGHAIQSLIAC